MPFYLLYRSVASGADEVECIYLGTTQLEDATAVTPESQPQLTHLSPLTTFCESGGPLSLPRDSRRSKCPLGYHHSEQSLFLLYHSPEEGKGLRVSGFTVGDRLKLPDWHAGPFIKTRLELALKLALLYVQCHVLMGDRVCFPNLETLVYVLPESMQERIKTNFSGELGERLCWRIPLGEEAGNVNGMQVSHRLAQEVAVLYAVLAGKDCLQGRRTTSTELDELRAELLLELELSLIHI